MQNIRAAFVHQHSDGALVRTYCPSYVAVFFFFVEVEYVIGLRGTECVLLGKRR